MAQFIIENGILTCIFEGPQNTNKCAEIENELSTQVAQAGLPVVFDLAAVDYVASSFFRLCITTGKKVGSNNFHVIHVNPELNKIFMIAGLGDLIGT
jgi:anti-anti-sigma factor